MTSSDATTRGIVLGDPVPDFSAPLLGDGGFSLSVAAGRWLVLSFLGSPADPRVERELAEIFQSSALFDQDRIVFYGIVTSPPDNLAPYLGRTSVAASFLADYDGTVSRAYGATDMPRTIVLDPMLRAIADIPFDYAAGHAKAVRELLASLPSVDDSAGVPLTAPVLIVPRVFDFSLCDGLIELYDKIGGTESGFLYDVDGKTTQVVDRRIKSRRDVVVAHPQLKEAMRSQIVRRLLPAIERFFQFSATRMDRSIVTCYDSAAGGHFYRHRDNVNVGAQHRRFAVSLNLNKDYVGGDLMLPEFGRRTYRTPVGGAVVFSCGALHQVTPVTRGKRYAFVAFLYGEADAALREANNAKLHQGAARYAVESDLLFPERDGASTRRAS